MAQRTYTKTFAPLESNPEVFTDLAHQLGLDSSITFTEIYSLDSLPQGKILAYVLIFPTTQDYDAERAAETINTTFPSETGKQGREEEVVFLRQTIHNACGLYAILHAVCNGKARHHIRDNSFLHNLLTTNSKNRNGYMDSSQQLEDLYNKAANAGDTSPPEDPGADVDYHYTCFVPSVESHKLYELDGDRQGPKKRAVLREDIADFDDKARGIIEESFRSENGERAVHFNVMALVDGS